MGKELVIQLHLEKGAASADNRAMAESEKLTNLQALILEYKQQLDSSQSSRTTPPVTESARQVLFDIWNDGNFSESDFGELSSMLCSIDLSHLELFNHQDFLHFLLLIAATVSLAPGFLASMAEWIQSSQLSLDDYLLVASDLQYVQSDFTGIPDQVLENTKQLLTT